MRDLTPDLDRLAALDANAVIVTAAGRRSDFVLRVFAPKLGLPEDPVCGTAHRIIVPFWAEQLGKTSLVSHQLSQRGGELFCELRNGAVTIAGLAVPFLEGMLRLGVLTMRFNLPPTGKLVTIRAGGTELVVAPECGARLVSFRVDGRDVLRPASAEALEKAVPYGFAVLSPSTLFRSDLWRWISASAEHGTRSSGTFPPSRPPRTARAGSSRGGQHP